MAPKKMQVAKQIQSRKSSNGQGKKNKQASVQLVVAPQTRAIRATVPKSQRQQCMVLEIKKGFQSFTLHPDNIPWMAAIAPSFQRWGMNNLRIWYEPRVSTSTNGTVAMAVLSDFKDATPTSFQSLTSVMGVTRGAPWDKFTLSSPKYQVYEYTKVAGLSAEDLNTRALGRIFTYADMDDDTTVAGRVYIEFTPVLLDPTDPSLQG
jgi:hypothetical protein